MKTMRPCQNERGAALVIGLMFLAIVAMLGTTAVVLTTTDMQIGANYRASAQALQEADAGVNYAIAKMEAGLKAGTFPVSGPSLENMSVGATTSLAAFTAPSGFSFSYKDPGLTKIAESPDLFTFTTVGADPSGSTVTIEATCKRMPAINMAAFGDTKLDVKSSAIITSYDSSSPNASINNPSVALTHEADIGSNCWLRTGSGSSIDGAGVLGETLGGSTATNAISDPTDFFSTTPLEVGRIDPDPLNVTSGGEYDPDTYQFYNVNALAIGLVSNAIVSGTPATLFGGAAGATANYYLTGITVKNGDTLTVDTSGGRGNVRVFLKGEIDLKAGSSIVFNPPSYQTTKFAIFSDSTAKISLKNSSNFIGLIYAPYCTNFDLMNNGDLYGAVFGDDVELKNSGYLRYDSALRDAFPTKDLAITTWRDLRQ